MKSILMFLILAITVSSFSVNAKDNVTTFSELCSATGESWVLILTMDKMGGALATTGAFAIDHITGFESSEMCMNAGNAWLSSFDKQAKALCVQLH